MVVVRFKDFVCLKIGSCSIWLVNVSVLFLSFCVLLLKSYLVGLVSMLLVCVCSRFLFFMLVVRMCRLVLWVCCMILLRFLLIEIGRWNSELVVVCIIFGLYGLIVCLVRMMVLVLVVLVVWMIVLRLFGLCIFL